MRLLGPVILILRGAVNRLRNQFWMRHAITSELVGYNFPGLPPVTPQQALEKPLCSSSISLGLKIHIHHFTVLVDGSP
jgi:hypothetical protein